MALEHIEKIVNLLLSDKDNFLIGLHMIESNCVHGDDRSEVGKVLARLAVRLTETCCNKIDLFKNRVKKTETFYQQGIWKIYIDKGELTKRSVVVAPITVFIFAELPHTPHLIRLGLGEGKYHIYFDINSGNKVNYDGRQIFDGLVFRYATLSLSEIGMVKKATVLGFKNYIDHWHLHLLYPPVITFPWQNNDG